VRTAAIGFVQDLKPEPVILKLLGQLLPRHLATDFLEIGRDRALVGRVLVALEVLALAFQDKDFRDRLGVLPFVHDEIGVDQVAPVALD
jgi:hypothetical protein